MAHRDDELRGAQYARQEMAYHAVGPRRTDSLRTYVRATRIIGGLSVLVLFGAIAWDLANDGFWSRHALFTSLVGSLVVVGLTPAVLKRCWSAGSASAGPCSRSTRC